MLTESLKSQDEARTRVIPVGYTFVRGLFRTLEINRAREWIEYDLQIVPMSSSPHHFTPQLPKIPSLGRETSRETEIGDSLWKSRDFNTQRESPPKIDKTYRNRIEAVSFVAIHRMSL